MIEAYLSTLANNIVSVFVSFVAVHDDLVWFISIMVMHKFGA